MKGVRLEVDYLFITCLTQHEEALASAVEEADIEIIDQMASRKRATPTGQEDEALSRAKTWRLSNP